MTAAEPTQISVRRARSADASLVGRALADAFTDDPVFEWLIPRTRSNRATRLETFFSGMAATYLRRDKHVFLYGDDMAAAMWASPESDWVLPIGEIVRQTPSAFSAFRTLLPRALRSQLQVESAHPKTPKHWYLGYLGTRHAHQGKGIGGKLLDEVLGDADRDHLPAYLESSCERNLTLYRRKGFEVVEEIRLLGTGPAVWRMWRDPA